MKRINLRLLLRLSFVFVFLFTCFSVFAQDGNTLPTTDPSVNPSWALLIGSGITIAITFLKKIPFIDRNPKLVATVLSVAVTAVTAIAGARAGTGVWPFVLTVLTQLAAAIGTHEVVVKTFTSSS
ncbi:MAG: hypothetical protein WBV94_00440 [Blastocatellia bacterium]